MFETIQSGFIKSLTIILQIKFNNLTIHFSIFKETLYERLNVLCKNKLRLIKINVFLNKLKSNQDKELAV
jgi:hypothetical protein